MREKILAVTEKNSRIDTKDLAVLLRESGVAVANGIARMEKERIICGCHILISWDNTSDERIMALIKIKVAPQRDMRFDKIAERIYQHNEVEAVYLMSDVYNLIMFIGGKIMKQVVLFISDRLSPIDPVLSTTTHFALERYKDHGTIPADTVQGERVLIAP